MNSELKSEAFDLADCWVQSADFAAEEFDGVTRYEALRIFEAHNWRRENDLYKELEAAGDENCPAGFAVLDGSIILHLCPGEKDTMMVHFNYPRRTFFLKRWTTDLASGFDMPLSDADTLVRAFFDRNFEEIRRLLRQYS